MPGFDGVRSTTRIVRLALREGVALDRLPHKLRFGGASALVVVPGRAPICLRCSRTGHIRRDCRAPRCSECRGFGHERADCVRSYVRAVERGGEDDRSELVMDEEEAERAAAPATTTTEQGPASAKDQRPDTAPSDPVVTAPLQLATVASALEAERLPTASEDNKEVDTVPEGDEELNSSKMDFQSGSAKRRHEDPGDVTKEQRLHQSGHEWRVVTGWKGTGGRQRSAVPKGGDQPAL